MQQVPTVSVILPLYNCEEYIGEAIESILSQSLRDFELLIINEPGSPTQTINRYAEADDRIRIIQKTGDKGISWSLNIGLAEARGKYIARMDADDVSLPERLKTQVEYMEQHPDIDICGSNVRLITECGYETASKKLYPLDDIGIKAFLLFASPFAHPTVMFRAESVKRYDMRYSTDFAAEDYELWVRMADRFKYANIEQPLLRYRVHGTQISGNPAVENSARIISQTAMNRLNINLTDEETHFLYNGTVDICALRQFGIIISIRKKVRAGCVNSGYCSLKAINRVFRSRVWLKPTELTWQILHFASRCKRKIVSIIKGR